MICLPAGAFATVHLPPLNFTRGGFVQGRGSSIRLSEAVRTVGVKIGGLSSPIEGGSEDPLNSYGPSMSA